MLTHQSGFIDALGLNSDTEANQFVEISVWKGPKLHQLNKALLQDERSVRTFNV
jgi:hypothetical protein